MSLKINKTTFIFPKCKLSFKIALFYTNLKFIWSLNHTWFCFFNNAKRSRDDWDHLCFWFIISSIIFVLTWDWLSDTVTRDFSVREPNPSTGSFTIQSPSDNITDIASSLIKQWCGISCWLCRTLLCVPCGWALSRCWRPSSIWPASLCPHLCCFGPIKSSGSSSTRSLWSLSVCRCATRVRWCSWSCSWCHGSRCGSWPSSPGCWLIWWCGGRDSLLGRCGNALCIVGSRCHHRGHHWCGNLQKSQYCIVLHCIVKGQPHVAATSLIYAQNERNSVKIKLFGLTQSGSMSNTCMIF